MIQIKSCQKKLCKNGHSLCSCPSAPARFPNSQVSPLQFPISPPELLGLSLLSPDGLTHPLTSPLPSCLHFPHQLQPIYIGPVLLFLSVCQYCHVPSCAPLLPAPACLHHCKPSSKINTELLQLCLLSSVLGFSPAFPRAVKKLLVSS